MSLNFTLRMATDLEPIKLLDALSSTSGFEWEMDTLSAPGLLVYAIKENALGQSIIEEAFGFHPDVVIDFRINPTSEYSLGKYTLLQATMELLHQFSGDAVLLSNGEDLVLQRIGGKLVVNKDWSNWSTSQLSEVTLPYEARSLSSPLL